MTRLLLLSSAYFATGWLGLQVPYSNLHITLVWLPTGIAVAALLQWGNRSWPAIYLGAFLVNISIGSSWSLAAGIAVGNTLGPLLAALAMRRGGFGVSFERRKDVGLFLAAASGGMAVSATGGCVSLYLAGLIPPESFGAAWKSWWMGDTVGVLLAAPVLLSLTQETLRRFVFLKKEVLIWSGISSLVAWLAFVHNFQPLGRELPIAFLTAPLITWAALRFGIGGAAFAGFGFSMVAVWTTAIGLGFHVESDSNFSLFLLWTYMASVVALGLLVTALESERKAAENELCIAAAAFESQEGTVVTDARGVILKVNQAFTESTGYTAEEAVGQRPSMLKSGRHDQAFYEAMWASIRKIGTWQGEIWDRRKNGEVYPKWLTISAVKGKDCAVNYYVGTHHDITERKKAEEKIRELAFFDPLTHLPNRTLLLDRLKQAMTSGNRKGTFGAVLFVDLDHFKKLNDLFGHDAGDLLLQQVSQRLVSCVREGDTVARLGGDEFVVLLESLSEDIEDAASQTEIVGAKLVVALNQSFQIGEIVHHSSASIGATLFRGHETSIDDVLKQADLAMYRSKESGRNALHFFDPRMESTVKARGALEADLREAIEKCQFVLHYQAQVMAGNQDQVTGAEALVRWQHPGRGLVPPGEFIALAEETGLIRGLGQWVLEDACHQLALWADQPEMEGLTVAVNVSVVQFRKPEFVSEVLAALERTGANPQRLKLELTESLLVENVNDVIDKMEALKARGVSLSLDDFGTGYSSLSYLKRLPLDQLKIDQSFVSDMLAAPSDAAIAKTIIALGESLGLNVIAEGVETDAQRLFLIASGCHSFQGYFFSRPLPVDEFEVFVRSRQGLRLARKGKPFGDQ